jgi:hypothetical protein
MSDPLVIDVLACRERAGFVSFRRETTTGLQSSTFAGFAKATVERVEKE